MRLSRLVVVPAAATVTALLPSATASAATAPASLPIPSDVPAAASGPAVGTVDPSSTVTFYVQVAGPLGATLKQAAEAVSDPASPLYRHFLSKEQMRAEYDPAPATTAAVVAGLRGLGLTVGKVTSDGRLITVSARAAQVTKALGVGFKLVAAKQGGAYRVATTQAVLPSAIRPLVANIVGLSQAPATPTVVYTPAYFIPGAPVEGTYWGQYTTADDTTSVDKNLKAPLPEYNGVTQNFTVQGYTPAQIRAAYEVDQTGLDGTGVKIGVVDAQDSPTMLADANEWSKDNGLPQFGTPGGGQYVDNTDPTVQAQNNEPALPTSVDGISDIPNLWYEEQALDVEMEHAMAPNATVEYYGAEAGIGTLAPLGFELGVAMADDTVQFVSDSYGIPESDPLLTPADKNLFDTDLQVGSLEGIGASFSSGDDADYVSADGVRDVSFPAASDMATAIGGTSLELGESNKLVGETYWGSYIAHLSGDGLSWGPFAYSSGGGGGNSYMYAEPAWQSSVVPDQYTYYSGTNSGADPTADPTTFSSGIGTQASAPGRVLPDISLDANPATGVNIGLTFALADGTSAYEPSRIGGTSVSSPLFGGLMALVIEQAQKSGAVGAGSGLGDIAPTLYKAYTNSPNAFRDASTDNPTVVRADYTNSQDPTSAYTYTLRQLGNVGTLHAAAGYDDSTGLGAPCASALVPALVKPTAAGASGPGCGEPPVASGPGPSVPESPLAVALPAGGLAIVVGLLLRRRRRAAA